ncbi:hypothetical protein TRFO_17165 [Tritrichomonas foetus]|uniref:Uncharacterized protein n=1 Tax=Tritrichomonas foetus TaxID=1144522 RepID=A0A1J4KPH8_9EUKA|nr:hypothetical protein TRFO_17165 [Tritrichomonas foetus]|eukprot:OHT12816.1 hypothetical protein TRFO_17165 [Tritrichomonas foetus]
MQDSNLYIYPDDFTAVVKSEDANTLYTTRKFSYSPNSKIKKDDYFNHLDKKKNTSNDGDDDFGRLIDSKGQILNIYSNEETSPNEGGLNKNMTFLKDCVYSFKKYAQICHKPCFFANTSLFDYNSRSKIKLIDISFDEDLDVKMDIQLSLSQKKQLYIKIGSQYLSGYIFDSNEYPNIVVSDGSFIEQENYQDDINLILNFISMNIITLEYTNFDLMKKVCSLLKLNEPFDIIARIYNNFKTNFQRIDYLGKVEEEILEIFDNIDHKNIDSHAEKLIMKIADMILANYTSKQIYIHFICSFLYTISYSRPLKNDILVKLIDILIKILPEGFQTQFNELLLSKLGMTDNFNFYFLHELMKHGIIPLDKILETISSHFSIKAAFWFFPYSENSTDYKYFSEDLEDRINFSLENETKSAMYKKLFNELRKDDYKLHKEYTKMGHSPDPLLKCIRDDDLETFQTYSTNISFDFGMLIFNDIFERSSFLCYRPNLLQYSAYFGSVKVFKYLFLQKVNKEYIDANGKNLLDYIIAGSCNAEILHIVDEIPDIYTNYAPITATTFHRYPIYEWLLGKYYSTNISQQEKIISKKSLILCYLESITSLNYPIFMNLMMDSQIRNEVVTLISLHTAIQSNNIEVTMFFSDLKNYEESASTLLSSAFGTTSDQSLFKFVKSKFVGNNSFAYHPTLLESIKNDNLHVFQYIIENYILKSQESQKEKDIYDHVSAINEVNPFVTACKCGALKIVKYLMKLPGFSILPLIKHSIHRKLTKRKFFMIVREILSIPNISIAELVPENKNCFTAACWMNFAHIAKFIYNKCKTDDGKNLIDVNKNGNRQETPLTGCACINNVDMGTFLLSLPETDINLPNKLHSQTAITCALNKGKVEFARLLLKHDNLIFDLNKALEKCLKIGSVNLVKDVLNHPNADFSEIDFFFDKAIDILLDIDVNVLLEIFRCKRINKTQDEINKIAYRFARSDIYRLYFDINNLPHYDDCIPLFEAIDINCEECVRYLLTNVPNLDVNERNQENDTPLFLAVKH